MPYYRIYGTAQYDASVRVEADSAAEALTLAANNHDNWAIDRGDFMEFTVDEGNEPEVEG